MKNKLLPKLFYLGIPGSNSFLAANIYDKKACFSGCKSISDIFTGVSRNKNSLGIVPIENSTTGSISDTFDTLVNKDLLICGEIVLRIHHQLLMKSNDVKIEMIKHCYSHPQAIGQCQKLVKRMKKVTVVYSSDTASSAKLLSEKGGRYDAVIANRSCAQLYNLKIIKEEIEDNRENFTRFFVIGHKSVRKGNKVSFVFSVAHQPGSLVATLLPFAKWKLNLTKIESRPIPSKPWEYLFFVDMEINRKDIFIRAVNEIRKSTNFIKILGYYPKGKIYET